MHGVVAKAMVMKIEAATSKDAGCLGKVGAVLFAIWCQECIHAFGVVIVSLAHIQVR